MPKAKTSRKQLFRAALAIAGRTAAQWAEEQGITPPYLSGVLNEKYFSKRLDDKIDAFVREHLTKVTALAG